VLRGRYVHPAGLRIRKSYGYVGNSVYQLERLIDAAPREVDGRVFWLADYPPIEVAAWAAEIRRCAGLGSVRSVPTWVLQAGGRAGDLLARLGMSDPPLTSFRVDNLLTEMVYDSGSTEHIAGELPFTMADGVRATVEWLRGGSAASVADAKSSRSRLPSFSSLWPAAVSSTRRLVRSNKRTPSSVSRRWIWRLSGG